MTITILDYRELSEETLRCIAHVDRNAWYELLNRTGEEETHAHAQERQRCDTCRRWDSQLVDGMCIECRRRYRVITAAGHGGTCCGGCGDQCSRSEVEEVQS